MNERYMTSTNRLQKDKWPRLRWKRVQQERQMEVGNLHRVDVYHTPTYSKPAQMLTLNSLWHETDWLQTTAQQVIQRRYTHAINLTTLYTTWRTAQLTPGDHKWELGRVLITSASQDEFNTPHHTPLSRRQQRPEDKSRVLQYLNTSVAGVGSH